MRPAWVAALRNRRRERPNVASDIKKKPSAVDGSVGSSHRVRMARLVSIGKVVGRTRNDSLRTPYVRFSTEMKNLSTSSAAAQAGASKRAASLCLLGGALIWGE